MNRDDLQDGIMQHLAGMEIEEPEAVVAIAIDMTLREVLGWLHQQSGDVRYTAEELEALTEMD